MPVYLLLSPAWFTLSPAWFTLEATVYFVFRLSFDPALSSGALLSEAPSNTHSKRQPPGYVYTNGKRQTTKRQNTKRTTSGIPRWSPTRVLV